MAPRSRTALLVFRLAVLVALGVSTALLIDYFSPMPAFCDMGSGCDQIRLSGKGKVFGVPLPVMGLAGFAVMMVLSLLRAPRAQSLARLGGVAAGFAGIALLLVQGFVLKVFCKLCVAVDISGIVVGIAALTMLLKESEAIADVPRARKWLWPVATIASMVIPFGWSKLQPSPPVPREILERWVEGKINVVEFIDFQCPFCRELHPVVHDLLEEYGSRVNHVRFNVPLPMHPQSHDAARAFCCADAVGKGTAMADALFLSEDLTPEACEKLAVSLGMSVSEFRTCVKNPQTDARLNEEMRLVRSAGLAGLPTVWVNDEVIVGRKPDALRDAFTRAATTKTSQRLPTSLLWGAFALALAAVGGLALRGRADQETS